jgi:hypothetical protein
MYRRRNRVDRRKLSGHHVAVRGKRLPKPFAVARRHSDDDGLRADATARHRLTERFVELGGFDRLCAGRNGKQRHRDERRAKNTGEVVNHRHT